MAEQVSTASPGFLKALIARREEEPAQGRVTPNLPLTSQSNLTSQRLWDAQQGCEPAVKEQSQHHQDGGRVQHRQTATCTAVTRKTK